MSKWLVLGATSKIAEAFALKAAQCGDDIILCGRDIEELKLIANDIQIRTQVQSEIIQFDFSNTNITPLVEVIKNNTCHLLIAQGQMPLNEDLTDQKIIDVIEINSRSTIRLIHEYLHSNQKTHRIIYLSSVAGDRGRAKNSFYGATKKVVDTYLEGLINTPNSVITIARLGFIDTKLTYGQPGIFHAAKPDVCGQYLFDANKKGKNILYFPRFWYFIMFIIRNLPLWIFRRLKI